METALNLMSYHPVFCTSDTRVAEIKYLLKKYDYDEILVLDSVEEKHPIGFILLVDMETDALEGADIPSDISAEDCMRPISAVVHQHSSLDECLNIMRANHMERIPVVDLNGHFTGMLEKEVVIKIIM